MVGQSDASLKVLSTHVVDRPTQLICIWIFICQHTSTKDIAGQSATGNLEVGPTYLVGGWVPPYQILWQNTSGLTKTNQRPFATEKQHTAQVEE